MESNLPAEQAPRPADLLRLFIFVGFIAITFLGGGGARADILSLLYVRPAAVLCLAAMILLPGRIDWRAVRVPLILLGLFAVLIGVQLIPLPPGIWMNLPGRGPIIEAAAVARIAQPWRPISMAPDLTLNSLAALTIPLTALVGYAALRRRHRARLLLVLILAVLASALLGLAQLSGGPDSPVYLYRITNDGSAVGLMANRNHQAFLLAATYPMLASWAVLPQFDAGGRLFRSMTAAALGIFLVPLILVTGSRAGLLFGLAGIVLASALYYAERRLSSGSRWKGARWAGLALLGIGGGVVAIAAALSRAEAISRLLAVDVESDLRLMNLRVFVRMARDFFPLGTGSGTFDPLYRIYEPRDALSPFYLNQAHNDLADLAITGGLPVLVLLLAFLIWWGMRSAQVTVRASRFGPNAALARVGAAVMLIFLAASLVDYPLRTPSLAMVFAICCGWLSSARRTDTAPAEASP